MSFKQFFVLISCGNGSEHFTLLGRFKEEKFFSYVTSQKNIVIRFHVT